MFWVKNKLLSPRKASSQRQNSYSRFPRSQRDVQMELWTKFLSGRVAFTVEWWVRRPRSPQETALCAIKHANRVVPVAFKFFIVLRTTRSRIGRHTRSNVRRCVWATTKKSADIMSQPGTSSPAKSCLKNRLWSSGLRKSPRQSALAACRYSEWQRKMERGVAIANRSYVFKLRAKKRRRKSVVMLH